MTVSTHKDNDKFPESYDGFDSCSICLDPLMLNPDVKKWPTDKPFVSRIKPCHHIYHDSCIKKWAQYSRKCPICRRKFNGKHIEQLENTVVKEKKYTTIMRHLKVNTKDTFSKLTRKLQKKEQ